MLAVVNFDSSGMCDLPRLPVAYHPLLLCGQNCFMEQAIDIVETLWFGINVALYFQIRNEGSACPRGNAEPVNPKPGVKKK
ncbi:hypothetical protein [Thiolapillus sp.]